MFVIVVVGYDMAEAKETDKLMENEEEPDKKLTKRDGTRYER